MSISSQEDLQALLRIGKIVALALQEMRKGLRVGMTTAELDEVGAAVLKQHGARSAPQLVYNFPGATCISLNEVAAHGIPGDRTIKEGDLVKIDVSAELDGYFADAAVTALVPPVSPLKRKISNCAKSALQKAMAVAQTGRPLNVIGRSVEREVSAQNLALVRELCGHGVGRSIHEEPRFVLNYYDPRLTQRLTEGLVIAIEPHVTGKATHIFEEDDGWTLKTRNSSPVASFEHTVVITNGKPIIVTAV